jgi:protease IV
VLDLVDRAPLFADESVAAGLIDRLGYRDEIYDAIRHRVGVDDEPNLLFIGRYGPSKLERITGKLTEARSQEGVVAVVNVNGPIHLGRSGRQPLAGGSTGSDSIGAAIRAAVRADDVKAIVLRVTSPGGSYVASDAIWREVAQARAAGRPVVVSMGDVAASGGYYVSMTADKIVAEPSTITGSIGVFAGKMVTSDFWQKLGVTFDEVHTGENATMWTGLRDYSPAERARFEAALDRIYDDFTSKVAAGRKLEKERVLEIAKGRIWTGEDALGLGLVDALGGYPEALRQARQALGLAADAPIDLEPFPAPRGLLSGLVERAMAPDDDTSEEEPSVSTLRAGLEAVHAVTLSLRTAGVLGDQGLLGPVPAPGLR